jgi:cell division septation protein DedD
MLQTSDRETEILLGNKQLIGIFFVVAVLLGVAFYGGYMVGKTAPAKTAGSAAAQETVSANGTPAAATGGQTHTLAPEGPASGAVNPTDATEPEPPLGSPRTRKSSPQPTGPGLASPQPSLSRGSEAFNPQAGQQFLQVTAVGRDEALGIADVLRKQGFRAHAVPKPGNGKVYRVLVGPVRDAGDLSTTRDALRKTGFREVIVQKY